MVVREKQRALSQNHGALLTGSAAAEKKEECYVRKCKGARQTMRQQQLLSLV